jgi:allophanate hydrolase subunit 1
MEFDLTLNFAVLAVDAAIREHPVDGLIETAPGFRTILVSYDPLVLPTRDLIERLHALLDHLPPVREMTIPSRVVQLPIAFDDSETRQSVQRYINTIRGDAPNCEGGNNIDYIVRYNGLADREELYHALLASEQWAAFIGFFPGLPFMFPLDPRDSVFVPKYNPTRTWTPEGAVGVGGPCWAIYPVESAGGYQLVGRTIPIYDLQGRNSDLTPLIFRAGDRAQFYRVSEEELLGLFEDVRADRFRYQLEERPLDVGTYLDWVEQVKDDADTRRRRREEAAAVTPVP